MTRLAVLAALVAGCSIFDTSGVGSGGVSVGEDTDHGTTSHADDAGDDTSTTTSGSWADGSTTGSTSSTTSSETSSSSSSSGSDPPETTSGGTTGPAYPTCIATDQCADPSHECLQLADKTAVVANYCAPPCFAVDECPVAETGRAMPVCVNDQCRLSCEAGEPCPDGMECFVIQDGSICAYPVD